jgi:hypothetical protein
VSRYPDGKTFAFSVFDDTDRATVANVRPVYELLADLGICTTKSVWALSSDTTQPIGGQSLAEEEYVSFVRWLMSKGFEIALHNVRNGDSTRRDVEAGLERFREIVGNYPRVHCNHLENRDNVYWGLDRFRTAWVRHAYNFATKFRAMGKYDGHRPGSAHFWGDLCRERIDYVRNFTFDDINLDNINPSMPYRDPERPYVKKWFSSSEGGDVDSFCRTLEETNQDRLEREGGVCIMYTHFAKGFFKDGQLDQRFVQRMTRLAQRPGWFVPVSTLLDRLEAVRGARDIPPSELRAMERTWFFAKLRGKATE